MTKINAADKMVQVMADWGIKNVYGLPGDSVDTTVEALYRKRSEISFTQVRHEEVAALAAAAYGKLTGQVGVCLSIGGPGAIHLLNGLYDAKMDHAPVVAIVGQVATNVMNTGFFQEINTPALFKDVAVYNKLVISPASLPRLMDEALRQAYTYKGVAVLTIPDDIPEHKITDDFVSSASNFHLETKSASLAEVDRALELLRHSKKPVVLLGKGAQNAGAEAKEFVEHYALPFIQTMPAKGIIADDHPNSLGQLGKLGTKPAFEAMANADLLILIGTDYPYTSYLNQKIPAIQIDANANFIGHRHQVAAAIVADAKSALTLLNARGELVVNRPFLDACQQNMRIWRSWMNSVQNKSHEGVLPSKLFTTLSQQAPDNVVWAIDVGTATSFGARFLDVQPLQKYVISSWLGTMGCALPSALAAKQIWPRRPVYAVCGDGAFSMVMQDFVTAVKYKLPIVVIVLNNKMLSFIKYEQQAAGQQNYAIDLADIDYAKFAVACGGIGVNVKTDAEFATALKQFQSPKRPVLINAAVADEAPLPGKIVMDEAQGYLKFGWEYFKDKFQIPQMPPLKEIMRQFF